jgi:flagellar basal-body rod protein FlgB
MACKLPPPVEIQWQEVMMAINIDKALDVPARALELRAYRAQLLATNIANADTPNYKAVDVDFKTALAKAQSGDLPLTVTNTKQIQASSGESSKYPVMYRVPLQPSLDGNTVDTEIEKASFTRNAIQHQADFMLLNGRIKGIMTAIKGQ